MSAFSAYALMKQYTEQLTARSVRKGYVYSLSTFAETGQGVYEHPPCICQFGRV
jgi:hypothetical protein